MNVLWFGKYGVSVTYFRSENLIFCACVYLACFGTSWDVVRILAIFTHTCSESRFDHSVDDILCVEPVV